MWLPDGDSLLVPIALQKEARAQIWQVPYPKGEPQRFTNDLSRYSPYLDLTRDGKTLAALVDTQISNIWVAPGGKAALATQITSEGVLDNAVAPGPNGKLLVRSQVTEVDLMKADGTERTAVMPDARTYSAMSNCGDRYIIFDSYTGTKSELWRTDADGSNPMRLVQQDVSDEDCSPDGKWLVYTSNTLSEGTKIYRMSVDGGTPTQIGNAAGGGGGAHISPGGKFVAYDLQEGSPVRGWNTPSFPLVEGHLCIHFPGQSARQRRAGLQTGRDCNSC